MGRARVLRLGHSRHDASAVKRIQEAAKGVKLRDRMVGGRKKGKPAAPFIFSMNRRRFNLRISRKKLAPGAVKKLRDSGQHPGGDER